MALKFVDELPRSKQAARGNNKYVGILVELVQNPDKWALILEYKGSASAYAMPRRLRQLPGWGKENVEFAARKNPGGNGSKLYPRYVGPKIPISLTEVAGNGAATETQASSFEELGPNQI